MFQNLRWRLLLSYLMVMTIILTLFSTGVYVFFSRSLYSELDKKLRILAEAAAPSLTEVKAKGSQYLEEVHQIPWSDQFDQTRQGLEWFDAEHQLLASQGDLKLGFPPRLGPLTLAPIQQPQIRVYTIHVANRLDQSLEGYVRASQSTEDLEEIQSKLLWGLAMGAITVVGLVGFTGFWLTKEALKPIEQSFKLLKQFTADASHELRGPLTAIKASVDVMQNHPERIHPKDVKKLSAIASATNQMIHLTEDLLFLARTATPALISNTDWKPLSLNKLLQDLTEFLEPVAHEKQITLRYQELAMVSVIGHEAQLTRLFSNLLRNGIQYTSSRGKVVLRLGHNNRFAIVSIEDTGNGIAPQELPFVFERFWRADKARSQREGGTGLGLSIAQAIAQRHVGKITVSSQVSM
ncbi:MAG: sensor histidine kinase, partial [Microcystaceae cyanobacterium]